MSIEYISVKEGTPEKGYWDMAFIEDLLDSCWMGGDRTPVIIPGAYQSDVIPEINARLAKFEKVLVFITSDEEEKFDCNKLEHPDIIHYHQYGTRHCNQSFPIGYTPQTRPMLKKIGLVDKDINVFFSGQLNSPERKDLFAKLAHAPRSILFGTDGFAKGLGHEDYFNYLAHAAYAPAPGGHISGDSFRFYEALEAGALPTNFPPYVESMFPDLPKTGDLNDVFAWWQLTKYGFKQQLKEDLGIHEAMTFVVPTSPIPSHPSTEIIEQTIESIRKNSAMPILITIDGVREEQKEKSNDYTEYIRRLLWKCNFEWRDVTPVLFREHLHQSGMMKRVFELIDTPLICYVEHDTPLVSDRPIEWGLIAETVMSDKANVVRFHYEEQIPEPHKHLMLPEKNLSEKFLATKQWSQRPHVAKKIFYENIMQYFSEESNCFIEDRVYGNCVEGNWEDWKVFIYTPDDKIGIKRSLNLDGRADDRKFEAEQIW